MVSADHAIPLLAASGVVKHFPGAKALDGVDFEVHPGEVHCLLGQNGAGKSTLIKVLSGAHTPDAGTIAWQGEEVTFPDPVSALRAGIATMYQELDVVDGLNVAENVFLGHERSRFGLSQRAWVHDHTRRILERLGHPEIQPTTEVGTLSAAGKQIVSLARALSRQAQLIIMDEPSAVLDSEEVANLFRLVRELTADGIGVVYISHRLEEIRQIGHRLTVLKDGRTVATGLPVAGTPTAEVIALMTGHEGTATFPPRPEGRFGEVVLSVRDLAFAPVFSGVSFDVHAGEIVGLAGLVGSGRSEILETIYGARRATAGEVSVAGRPLRRGDIAGAVARGVGLCPEERKSQGLLLEEPLVRNTTLSIFARLARAGFLDDAAELAVASEQVASLGIRPADPQRAARTFSGGNQQKILLGRWLAHGTRALILDEPTRGVDVGARAEAYDLIRELAASGVAILIVSSELEEVIGLADRVLVISDGRVIHTSPAAEIDEHTVLDLIMEGSPA
ncbi:MAG: sugar ABC transporter ATP-binding protein [Propionicimonas sp.]|nr:sugar ABC transporter ATP-binding protein [Propionicimonas sp.]